MILCGPVELKVADADDDVEQLQQPAVNKATFELSSNAMHRFESVCAMAQATEHHNLAAVIDYGFAQDGPFVVTEQLEGLSLSELFAVRGALNAVTTAGVFSEIVDALEFAHAHNIWIGDLSPERIFVNGLETNTPTVKLYGIGISDNAFEQDISARSLICDPLAVHYASPERCLGKQTDERSIVYSIGLMLFEVVFGKRAFDGPDHIKLLFEHVNAPNPASGAIARKGFGRFHAVVEKCLHPDASKRFKSLAQLRHHIDNLEEPIKNEAESNPAQLAEMYLTGARTPFGARIFTWAVALMILLLGTYSLKTYQANCDRLQRKLQKLQFTVVGKSVPELIDQWTSLRDEGQRMGQSRVFSADCDMKIAALKQSAHRPDEALALYSEAAAIYRKKRMPSDELMAIDGAIGVYRPDFGWYDVRQLAHSTQLSMLYVRRIELLHNLGPTMKWDLGFACLDYAEFLTAQGNWDSAHSVLKALQRKYPDVMPDVVRFNMAQYEDHMNYKRIKPPTR